ncbi:MAG: hypothetical protein ACUVRU_12795 [Anaerolineae bacterium]
MAKAQSRQVTQQESLTGLREALAAVGALLNDLDQNGLVIGGVAASLLGKPRLTADVDVVVGVGLEQLPRVLECAKSRHLNPRYDDAEAFARANRVLLLRHTPTGVGVDISFGLLPFEVEAIERGQVKHVGGAQAVTVRLPTPEDLVIFKAVARRPKDMLDIQAVIDSNPDMDLGRIEYWVRQFAEVLEDPSVWEDVREMLRPTDRSRGS